MTGSGKVLIVDDDPAIQTLLREYLTPEGYQLFFAEHSQHALELLQTGNFGVAILDIVLPGINGIEILQRVQGKLPHTEIIVLTGYASLETAILSMRLGAYDYATKPFSAEEIQATVKRAMEKQRLESRLAAIQDLCNTLTLALDVQQIAEAMLDIATRVLELEHCELLMIDPTQNELYPLAMRGMPQASSSRLALDSDEHITAVVARSGEALYVPDTHTSPQYVPARPSTRSELAVPLKVQERVIGVLNIASGAKDAFGSNEVRLLRTLAVQSAAAIENARLYAQAQHEIQERIRAEAEIKRRSQELAALNEIGQAITSTLDLQDTLDLITQYTTQLMNVAATAILLRNEDPEHLLFAASSGENAGFVRGRQLALGQGVAGWVVQHGQPALAPDVTQDSRWYDELDRLGKFDTRSILCVPLQTKGHTIGAIEAINKRDGLFDDQDVRLLSALAAPAATAIENARLFEQVRHGREQLQALSRRLVEVQEAERRHIARELHDETGQALSSLLLGLSLLEREARDPTAVIARAVALEEMVDQMLENLHRLAMNLRPATLDHLGLTAALEQYIETFGNQHGLSTQFEMVGMEGERLPPAIEISLYRIVQEAMTNVIRHAQADRVDVLLEKRGDQIVTIVEDNGVGFDPEAARQSGRLGLFGMRERAEMLGGSLTIESAVGKGTTIFVEVPSREVST
jgi:signal transduction histidine kinase/DNA-binding response OmpR family regulator